jgi:hypothetical protein
VKAISITVSSNVYSLIYPASKAHAHYCIDIRDLSGSKIFYSTLSNKRHDFRKRNCGTQNLCFGFFRTFSLNILILRIIERGMITDVYRSSYQITVVIVNSRPTNASIVIHYTSIFHSYMFRHLKCHI